MAHEKHFNPPVPPANRPNAGPPDAAAQPVDEAAQPGGGAPFDEQDAKRRLGNFEGAGEAPYKQPGGNNDANRS